MSQSESDSDDSTASCFVPEKRPSSPATVGGGSAGGRSGHAGGGGSADRRRQRARSFVWTLNNYTVAELDTVRSVVSNGATYCAFQPERGEAGTPHLQGVVCFGNPRERKGVCKLLGGRAFVEPMRGTIDQAVAYASKADSRDQAVEFGFTEFGVRPAGAGGGRGHRTDLEQVCTALRAGGSIEGAAETHPGLFVRYFNGLQRFQGLWYGPRDWKTSVYWFYGPTGCGKSHAAFDAAGGPGSATLYVKMPENKWWDGYQGQTDVIVDDYRRDFCTFATLLRLFDQYPQRVEVKGGSLQFRAKRLWITTAHSPEVTWENRSEEDMGQLMRRLTEVKLFDVPFVPVEPNV